MFFRKAISKSIDYKGETDNQRQIPFSIDLMNVTLSHFGDINFSKLWVRPNIQE